MVPWPEEVGKRMSCREQSRALEIRKHVWPKVQVHLLVMFFSHAQDTVVQNFDVASLHLLD